MIKINGLCLIIDNQILVLSDIHLGYEEALNKRGFMIPRLQFKDIVKNLEKVLENKKFKKIIVNGDLKHEFGKISEQEWKHSLLLIDLLSKHSKNVILIRGNHDKQLGPIAKKKNLEIVEDITIKDMLIIHGNKEVPEEKLKKIKTIIIGHEHPAISISEGMRAEKYKCFLFGKYKRKNLIVMPSFNPIVEGTDVAKERLLSPYIKNIDEFRVVAIGEDGTAFDFGKIKELKYA